MLALTTVSALTVVVATLSLLSSVRQPKFLRHVTIRQSSVRIACRAPIGNTFTWFLVTNENYSQEPFTWFLFTTLHVLHSIYMSSSANGIKEQAKNKKNSSHSIVGLLFRFMLSLFHDLTINKYTILTSLSFQQVNSSSPYLQPQRRE